MGELNSLGKRDMSLAAIWKYVLPCIHMGKFFKLI